MAAAPHRCWFPPHHPTTPGCACPWPGRMLTHPHPGCVPPLLRATVGPRSPPATLVATVRGTAPRSSPPTYRTSVTDSGESQRAALTVKKTNEEDGHLQVSKNVRRTVYGAGSLHRATGDLSRSRRVRHHAQKQLRPGTGICADTVGHGLGRQARESERSAVSGVVPRRAARLLPHSADGLAAAAASAAGRTAVLLPARRVLSSADSGRRADQAWGGGKRGSGDGTRDRAAGDAHWPVHWPLPLSVEFLSRTDPVGGDELSLGGACLPGGEDDGPRRTTRHPRMSHRCGGQTEGPTGEPATGLGDDQARRDGTPPAPEIHHPRGVAAAAQSDAAASVGRRKHLGRYVLGSLQRAGREPSRPFAHADPRRTHLSRRSSMPHSALRTQLILRLLATGRFGVSEAVRVARFLVLGYFNPN